MDFIIKNNDQKLSNGFFITFGRIIIRERLYSTIFLINFDTEEHIILIKKSNKIFRFNEYDLSMEYVCNENSPFLNIVFKGD